MSELRLLYVTTKNRDEARSIGHILVNRKLCACVNILDGMESMYFWEDEVQSDRECILLVKTTSALVEEVTSAIVKHHSYDVPCVISLPLSDTEGNSDFIRWIKNSVGNPNQ